LLTGVQDGANPIPRAGPNIPKARGEFLAKASKLLPRLFEERLHPLLLVAGAGDRHQPTRAL
jgi:hypothetical protein